MPIYIMCGKRPCTPCSTRKRLRKFYGQTFTPEPVLEMGDDTPLRDLTEIADFIASDDKLAAWLAIAMYQQMLPPVAYGYTLVPRLSSARIGVYQQCNKVIVAFRGTQPHGRGGSKDLLDDLAISEGGADTCILSITGEGVRVLRDLQENGVTDITLSGHSLGGKAALCLGNFPGVKRVVALNAGAPIVAPIFASAGPGRAVHYHIVGDVISTHVEPSAATVYRIRVGEKVLNWTDPFYHSSARFFKGDGFRLVSPQEEQDEYEDFFMVRGRTAILFTSLLTSYVSTPFYGKIRDLICTRPIPGSEPRKICNFVTSKNQTLIEKIAAGIVGVVIGAVLGNVPGAITGLSIALGITDGDLTAALSELVPGFSEASKALKKAFIEIFRAAAESNEEPYSVVQDLAREYFGDK